jgi:predicted ATPase
LSSGGHRVTARVSGKRDDTARSSAVARDRELPTLLDRFVGRARELAELADLTGHARLLTLTGPGGVGKTRLALALAHRVQPDFDHGVAFVDIGVDEAAASVTQLVGSALALPSHAQPATIADTIGNRQLLLLLDNCSRQVDDCAELALALLSHCPRLTIVATSVERLGVPGETLWQVPPLSVPESTAPFASIAENDAVQLLVERMIEVNPRFELDEAVAPLVTAICRRLDGLPLALELAAGWVNALSLGEIAEGANDPLRLLTRGARGAPERHQTLRASLDWSTEGLDPAERHLLRRLAVFPGSWDLDAARVICADDAFGSVQVLPTLAELVSRSLIQVVSRGDDDAARYRFLTVVRCYALEQLEAAGELSALRQRHADWYRALAEATPVGAAENDQVHVMLREQENLRAALEWAIAQDHADLAHALAGQLHAIWYIQGQFAESRVWFSRVLGLSGGSSRGRTTVANWASIHALCHGDIPEALRLAELAQQIAQAGGSTELIAFSLDSLGTVLADQGKLAESAAVFEREGALLQDLDLDWLLACVYYRLAGLRLEAGDNKQAEALCSDALRALGPRGNLWIRMRIERILGRIELTRGEYDAAALRFEFALNGTQQFGDIQGQTYALLDLARAAQERRQLAPARQWLRDALAITRLDTEPLRLTRVLEAAGALLASARPEGCLQIVTAAERVRTRMGAPLWPLERQQLARTLEIAHSRLSLGAIASATASGDVLEPDRAVHLAIELLDSLGTPPSTGTASTQDLLTPREYAVADLVSQGLTNRAIAQVLVISEGTARAHVEHILSKLALRSRTEIGTRLEHDARTPRT